MKKLILLALVFSFCFSSAASLGDKSPNIRKTMKMFKSDKDVEYISVPMFLVRWFIPKEFKEYKPILRKIKSFGVMSYEGNNEKIESKITKRMDKVTASAKMKTLVEIHDGSEEISLKCRTKKGKIKELFIYVKEKGEITLIHLKSNLKLSLIQKEIAKLFQSKDGGIKNLLKSVS